MKITRKDLDNLVARINTVAGIEDPGYNNGYCLDGAYGGWQLQQYTGESGGVRQITYGYLPKKELYGQMQAFCRGLMEAKEAAATKINNAITTMAD